MSAAEVKVDFDFVPRFYQAAAHQLRGAKRFLVLVWHRRAGKTVFADMELVLEALQAKTPKPMYAYIAPSLKQAKRESWPYLKSYSLKIPGVRIHESELWIEFPHNEARIYLLGADDPDSIRGGYFDGCVLDEVADMRPDTWPVAVRPRLIDRKGWCIFLGTPKGINLFSERYYYALKKGGEWGADLRTWRDTGVIDEAELASMRDDLTPAQFAQEMECDFNAAVDDTFIPLDLVQAAQERDVLEAAYSFAPKVLGIDVARYGNDSNVFQRRQGLVAFRPRALRGLDTMQVAAMAAEEIDKWQPAATFLDVGGIGTGVFDRLTQLNYSVVPVDFGGKASQPRFENKRIEMWWAVRDWLPQAAISSELRLRQDLVSPKYTHANARGRVQLESKESMKARGLPSTDYGDALACTFFAPVASAEARVAQTRHAVNPYLR